MAAQRDHLHGQALWLAVLDVLCLVGGILAGIIIRLGPEALDEYLLTRLTGWAYLAIAIVLANYISGAYGMEIRFSRFNMVVNWLFSLAIALLTVSVTSYAWFELVLGRGVLLWSLAVYSVLWLGLRLVIYHWLFGSERFAYRVVILGTGPAAARLLQWVENPHLRPAHRVVAMVRFSDLSGQSNGAMAPPGVRILQTTTQHLAGLIRPLGAHVVLIGLEREEDAHRAYSQLRRLRFEGYAVLSAVHAAEVYSGRVPLDLVDEAWLMEASVGSASRIMLRFKRIMDVVIVGLTLSVALPLGLLIALLIKLSAAGSPVLYSQIRLGRFGRPFRIYKFRTMIPGAEPNGAPVWSPPDDSRVTRLGRLLRRYRLDELPQLLNILRGEMSLVGPRPERPEIAAELEKRIPFYRERENVMPGLTGWAQIRYPYGSTLEDARAKLEYDLYYIKNLSFALDLRILLRTLRIVVFGLEREMR